MLLYATSSPVFVSEYYLKDHLGNTRVSFLGKTLPGNAIEITGKTDYYPFGLAMSQYSTNIGSDFSKNKYLYNGKEIQDDKLNETFFGWLDYGARFYDPQIGRWHSVDPMTEKNRRWNPYNYCKNNPLMMIDPDGMYDQALIDKWTADDLRERGMGEHNVQMRIQGNSVPSDGKPKNYIEPGAANKTKIPSANLGTTDANEAPTEGTSASEGGTSNSAEGGTNVYIEKDGIGHAYIEINGTVFTYGRYNGSYSPWMGKFGPVGPGVLNKFSGDEAAQFIKERTSKYPTDIYKISEDFIDSNNAYNYLNGVFNSGATNPDGPGKIIDKYIILGNNCSTLVGNALEAGGLDVFQSGSPAALGNSLSSLLRLLEFINK